MKIKMNLSELTSFIYFSLLLLMLYIVAGNGEAINCTGPIKTITVSQWGKAQFKTIQSAIDSISTKTPNTHWIHIKIAPGSYREQVKINKLQSCLYLDGAGAKSTIIEWAQPTVYLSDTFSSKADNIVAKGITFKNWFDIAATDPDAVPNEQAVAARVEGDKCSFFRCAFVSMQDTLLDHSNRHYFYNCYIQGGIDFIFGEGQSIYEKCNIFFSRGRNDPPGSGGYITANRRSSNEDPSGFVFKNCNITGKGKGVAYLGRSYGNYSRVIIANSYLSDVVAPQGWVAWNGVGHEGNFTYVEEGCRGPGSDKSKRVPWMKHLSRSQLQQYVNISWIDQDGWVRKHSSLIGIH